MEAAVIEKRKVTYQDYLKTPDDKRYELLNGKLFMSPAPYTKHQIIAFELSVELRNFVKNSKSGIIFIAPTDVYFDEDNVVQPDILFISNNRKNIITEKNIQGAPDLIVEIVSQSGIHRDMVEKKALYEKFGVKEYWLVFPDEELLEIYLLKNNVYQLHKTFLKEEILESSTLQGLKIYLKEIF